MAEIDLGKVALTEEEKNSYLPKGGGTLTGPTTAFNNNSMDGQIRNIAFATEAPAAIPDGQIVMVYE